MCTENIDNNETIKDEIQAKIDRLEDSQGAYYTITLDQLSDLESASNDIEGSLDALISWKSKFDDLQYDMDNAENAISEIEIYN